MAGEVERQQELASAFMSAIEILEQSISTDQATGQLVLPAEAASQVNDGDVFAQLRDSLDETNRSLGAGDVLLAQINLQTPETGHA